jgi:NTP pyrophosphatase (non-canonical NTP hydrolase)
MKESLPHRESETTSRPIDEIQNHLSRLYSERDSIYLPSREEKINVLNIGIGDLARAVFKGYERQDLEGCLARVVSRLFSIARSVDNVSVAEGLIIKYPKEGCAYCGQLPCRCQSKRPEASLGNGNISQKNWSIHEWQDHLGAVYGDKNNAEGIYYILTRLNLERDEFIVLESDIKKKPMRIEDAKREYQLELADAMAWTIAAANFLGIDLESAVEERYGNGCKRCRQVPCKCGPHDLSSITEKKKRGEE